MELTKKEEQGVRLFTLIEALNLNQTQFSKQIGVSQTYVNLMLKGKKSISYKVITAITKGFEQVNVRWLMTGDGDKFLSGTKEKSNGVEESVVKYETKPVDALGALRELLERHEERIGELERQVRRLLGEEDK